MQDVDDIDPANDISAKDFKNVGYYYSFCCKGSLQNFSIFSIPTDGTHASFRSFNRFYRSSQQL